MFIFQGKIVRNETFRSVLKHRQLQGHLTNSLKNTKYTRASSLVRVLIYLALLFPNWHGARGLSEVRGTIVWLIHPTERNTTFCICTDVTWVKINSGLCQYFRKRKTKFIKTSCFESNI